MVIEQEELAWDIPRFKRLTSRKLRSGDWVEFVSDVNYIIHKGHMGHVLGDRPLGQTAYSQKCIGYIVGCECGALIVPQASMLKKILYWGGRWLPARGTGDKTWIVERRALALLRDAEIAISIKMALALLRDAEAVDYVTDLLLRAGEDGAFPARCGDMLADKYGILYPAERAPSSLMQIGDSYHFSKQRALQIIVKSLRALGKYHRNMAAAPYLMQHNNYSDIEEESDSVVEDDAPVPWMDGIFTDED